MDGSKLAGNGNVIIQTLLIASERHDVGLFFKEAKRNGKPKGGVGVKLRRKPLSISVLISSPV